MLHIGYNVTRMGPTEQSGIGVYSWQMLQALAKQPVKITLFTTSRPAQLPPEIQALKLPQLQLPHVPNGWLGFWQTNTALVKAAERAGVDVLYTTAPGGPVWGRFKKVCVVHDLYHKVMPALMPWHHRLRFDLLWPLSFCAADAVVNVSPNTMRDVVKYFGVPQQKLHVVLSASPVQPRPAKERTPPTKPLQAVFVANITPNKNIGVLVEAAKLLKAQQQPVVLRHIGRDSYGLLAARLREADVGDYLQTMGPQPQDVLEATLRSALCVVVPSVYEGFSFPALEAQASNVPLVTTRGGALPDTAGEGALYFEPHDAAGLADHLVTLAKTPAERERLIVAGQKNLTRFSWEKSAAQLVALFQDLMKA